MFTLSNQSRYFLCQRFVDMRNGANGLYKLVKNEMGLNPLNGDAQLLAKVNELLARIASLEEALVHMLAEAEKEKKARKGLSKLLKNESEQQKPANAEPKPRSKTNNGAKRKND